MGNLTEEKQIEYLKKILDDEIMLKAFKHNLDSKSSIEAAIWYTTRNRDTDRAIHHAKENGILPR